MNRESGFSLVEVLIVIAIISALLGAGFAAWNSFIPGYRLNTAVSEVQAGIQMAKIKAIKQNGNVAFAIDTANDTWRVFVDDGATADTFDAGEEVVETGILPVGINMVGTSDVLVVFNGRGLPENPRNIQMFNSRGRYLGIEVNVAGGMTLQESADAGANWQDFD